MIERLGRFIVERPLMTLSMILAITILLGTLYSNPGLFGMEKDEVEREESWLPDNDIFRADKEISEDFGIQAEYMQVLVRADNVLEKDALIDIMEVEGAVAEDEKVQRVLYPGPGNVTSIADVIVGGYADMEGIDLENATYADRLAYLEEMDQATIDAIALNAGGAAGMFLTKDFPENALEGEAKAKGTMLLLMVNSSMYDEIEVGGDNPVLDADHAILDILKAHDHPGVERMSLIEEEYINERIDKESGATMEFLLMMVFVLIIAILLLTYRSILDTVISLMALMFAITWMNGLGVLMGLTFSTMYDAVPIMLMGLGIDYAIHLVMRYREERVQTGRRVHDALVMTIASVGTALVLATLTTAISFGSNLTSEIRPIREFSLFALVGIVSAFITSVTFVPAVKSLLHGWQERRGKTGYGWRWNPGSSGQRERTAPRAGAAGTRRGAAIKRGDPEGGQGQIPLLSRVLAQGAVAAEHHAYTVVAAVVVVSLISSFLAVQLETEFDFTEFLPEGSEVTDDIIFLTDNFDFGTERSNVLIKADIADPAVLAAVNETQGNIIDDSYVNEDDPLESILTLIQDVARGGGDFEPDPVFAGVLEDNDADADGIPDTREGAIELFDYLMRDERYLFQTLRVLHYDEGSDIYDGAVIRVGVNSQNGAKAGVISDELEDDIRPLEREPAVGSVVATSGPVLIHYVIRSIEINGTNSLIITVIVGGIILTCIFYVTDRSLVLGLLTEIPVVLVIAWVYASMYLVGMPLNVMTIMISSMTIGLGITYGIHVTHRFVEDLGRFEGIDEATRSTVRNTGAALLGAAVTTIGGFGVLAFAPIPPLKTFGIIVSLSITFSLVASVFILPTFLTLWARYVKRRDPTFFRRHEDVRKRSEGTIFHEPGEGPRRARKAGVPAGRPSAGRSASAVGRHPSGKRRQAACRGSARPAPGRRPGKPPRR
ncbi:MAG: MMPL family transporter [Thermoplasmata archaeon]|nr:MMPL family transporter [Thermoplasmata archaeon]